MKSSIIDIMIRCPTYNLKNVNITSGPWTYLLPQNLKTNKTKISNSNETVSKKIHYITNI